MSIYVRPKSPNELKQFIPIALKEIHRLYNYSSNISIVRTSENMLADLTREELLKILIQLWKESHCFEIEQRNFTEQILKNPEKKFYNPEPPLIEDYIFITPSNDEPIYLKITPAFIDLYPQPKISISPSSIKLPANMKWEDIHIKFLNGNDVIIEANGKKFESDFKLMGFKNKKNHQPNKQWELLRELADKNGEKAWRDSPAEKDFNIKKTAQNFGNEFDDEKLQNRTFSIKRLPNRIKTCKKELAKSLKTFFSIPEDPFFPYQDAKAYKIKIRLSN